MTYKYKFTALLLFLCLAFISKADNIMFIHDITAQGGETITIELEILNNDEFVGFNFDVPLPPGFTYINESAQLYRDDGHILNFGIISGNTARAISFSIPTKAFVGNSGIVVSFDVETPDNEGTYVLNIIDAVIADAIGNNIITGSNPGTITLLDSTIPNNVHLNNVLIFSGTDACFNANETIFTGGDEGMFIVETDASVTLIAGQNIIMQPGTHIMNGSLLHAYIAPDGPFCDNLKDHFLLTDNNIPDKTDETTGIDDKRSLETEVFFKVYPNPTRNQFIVELPAQEHGSTAIIEVFSMRGEQIIHQKLYHTQQQHSFNLEGNPNGIYLIRVIQGERAGSMNIIKH